MSEPQPWNTATFRVGRRPSDGRSVCICQLCASRPEVASTIGRRGIRYRPQWSVVRVDPLRNGFAGLCTQQMPSLTRPLHELIPSQLRLHSLGSPRGRVCVRRIHRHTLAAIEPADAIDTPPSDTYVIVGVDLELPHQAIKCDLASHSKTLQIASDRIECTHPCLGRLELRITHRLTCTLVEGKSPNQTVVPHPIEKAVHQFLSLDLPHCRGPIPPT